MAAEEDEQSGRGGLRSKAVVIDENSTATAPYESKLRWRRGGKASEVTRINRARPSVARRDSPSFQQQMRVAVSKSIATSGLQSSQPRLLPTTGSHRPQQHPARRRLPVVKSRKAARGDKTNVCSPKCNAAGACRSSCRSDLGCCQDAGHHGTTPSLAPEAGDDGQEGGGDVTAGTKSSRYREPSAATSNPLQPTRSGRRAASPHPPASVVNQGDYIQGPATRRHRYGGGGSGSGCGLEQCNAQPRRLDPTTLNEALPLGPSGNSIPSQLSLSNGLFVLERRQDLSPGPVATQGSSIDTGLSTPSSGGQPASASGPPSLSQSSTSPTSGQLPTSVIITIVLASVAGLTIISLAFLCLHLRYRRRRAPFRRRPSRLRMQQGDIKVPSNIHFPATPSPASATPIATPPATALEMASNAESRFTAQSPHSGGLTPPPRLLERNFHHSTQSDSSVYLVKKYTHKRWGKPSSLSILTPGQTPPRSPYRTLEHGSGAYRNDSEISLTSFRNKGAMTPGGTSPTSPSFHCRNGLTSPPRTPRQNGIPRDVMGLASPGPPPNRALPSPPLKYWQVNPLSPPSETELDHVLPEEIGIAISSPSEDDLSYRGDGLGYDESGLERMAATYSPFQR